MQYIADFHLHSSYSRATSKNLNLETLSEGAKIKGLQLLATGDWTHPLWFKELKKKLEPSDDGIFEYNKIHFTLATEVATIFPLDDKVRHIHHNIHVKSFDVAEQVNDQLGKFGNLMSDGRPMLKVSAPELVEILMGVDKKTLVYPNHAWTPWRSVFGKIGGFDSLEECYQDQTKNIFALETGLSCYDNKTEILTESGWKKVSEVKYSDRVCTLNSNSNEIEFQNPMKIYRYRYRDKMYHLKTKRVDLLVTPNHNLFYSPCDFRTPKPYRLREARFLFGKSKRFKKDGIWIGKKPKYFILPSVEIRHGSRHYSGLRKKVEKRFLIEPWLKFFGFWLAEGWVSEGKNGDYDVCISNNNKALLDEMEQILENFGYNVYQRENIIRVRDFQLFAYLKQFGKASKKFVPLDIKALSKELLEILLLYYVKGDGHVYGRNNKGLSATTISVRLRDDLQELALKIGISAYYKLKLMKGTPFKSPSQKGKIYYQSEDSWDIYFIRKNQPIILPSTIKKYKYIESWEDYDGFVFCVAVPNHIIYIRRNGIPLWCGNSDPPMNWRLSKLDDITLISNSDAHSANPWRLGREANVFDFNRLTYDEIYDTIKNKDGKKFLYTIEVDPNYGKYHFSGHRDCNVSLGPKDAIKLNNKCPRCGRKLTFGVLQRVEELADREDGFVPKNAIPFKSLLPLYEIISFVTGVNQLYSKKVIEEQNKLLDRFDNEFNVLLNVDREDLMKVTSEKIADAIIKVREGKVKFEAGYDGVYGKPIFNGSPVKTFVDQKSLSDFK